MFKRYINGFVKARDKMILLSVSLFIVGVFLLVVSTNRYGVDSFRLIIIGGIYIILCPINMYIHHIVRRKKNNEI